MSDGQFTETHAKLASAGGFTVNPRTGADITTGISVAPRGNERRDPITDSGAGTLKDFAVANVGRWTHERDAAGNVTAVHNASLGGWRSENHDVLDTPTVYRNSPGGQTAARKNMILSGQESAYDLDSGEEIHNPFHPKGLAAMGMEPSEFASMGFLPEVPGQPVDHAENRRRAEVQLQQPEVQHWVNGPAQRGQWDREKLAAQKASRSGPRPNQGKKR